MPGRRILVQVEDLSQILLFGTSTTHRVTTVVVCMYKTTTSGTNTHIDTHTNNKERGLV